MPKRPQQYWQILSIWWGSLILAFGIAMLILDITTATFFYLLFSIFAVAWLFHKIAREKSVGQITQKHYIKAKTIVEDMEGVDVQTLCLALDMEYADVCYLLEAMEAEGFITPRRLKFPSVHNQ